MILFALTVVGTAKPAWAKHHHHHPFTAGACGGSITPAILMGGVANPGPFAVGDTVTIQATIQNPNPVPFKVTDVKDWLSCVSGGNFFTCTGPDDTATSFAGNIQTTCGVTFTADIVSVPGQVILTPSTPLVLASSASCIVSFDETINNVGTLTPKGTINGFDADEGFCNSDVTQPGSAQGSFSFLAFQCSVEVDKEVSCDGGLTFFDVTGVDDTEPPSKTLSSLCIGFNAYTNPSTMTLVPATDIIVRYKARNTGSLDATCSTSSPDMAGDGTLGLFDSNLGILPAGVTVASIPATQTAYTQIDQVTAACSDSLAASEPDTATLKCQCAVPGGGSAFAPETMDSATFACESPALGVTKTCGAADASGNSAVSVNYVSTGTAPLSGCTLTDTVFAGACVNGLPSSNIVVGTVTGIPASLTDPTASPTTVSGLTATGLNNTSCNGADCCNQATVTCNVTGSPGPETISAANVADCPIQQGDCFTRTPGFWGTHPKSQDLIIAESPFDIFSCGVDLDTSLASTQGSGTEDICSIGGGQKNPPQTTISNTQRQLERQCAAANFNLAVSAFENVSCEAADPGITTTVATCCNNANSVCNTGGDTNGCIGALDAFNNAVFGPADATDFGPPGAQPAQCQAAKKSGFVNSRPRP